MVYKKGKKQNKKKFNLKGFFKGFTLVELLAVIVILAIIMIIAIPSVLSTLETSRRKSFLEYFTKVYSTIQTKWVQDSTMNSDFYKGSGSYIYNIKKDLGFSSTGSYGGYVLVLNNGNTPNFYIYLYDDNYFMGIDITNEGLPVNYDDKVQEGKTFHVYNVPGESFIHNRTDIEKAFGQGLTFDTFDNDGLACFISHYWNVGSASNERYETLYYKDGTTKTVYLKYFEDDTTRITSLRSCLA